MKTKHLPLMVGIALPVIFIILVSVVIFTPSLFIKPQYNFLYSTNDYYRYNQNYRNAYSVEGDHLILESVPVQPNITYQGDAPGLYLYDVKTDSSHKVTFEEVKKYVIDPGPSSPDGYTVKYEYSNDGIFSLFGPNNDNMYFIEKGRGRKALTGLVNDGSYSYYQGSFKVIGWIK